MGVRTKVRVERMNSEIRLLCAQRDHMEFGDFEGFWCSRDIVLNPVLSRYIRDPVGTRWDYGKTKLDMGGS